MAVVSPGGNGYAITKTIRQNAFRVGKISIKLNIYNIFTKNSDQCVFKETPYSISKKGISFFTVKDIIKDSYAYGLIIKPYAYIASTIINFFSTSLNSLPNQISFKETPNSISKHGVDYSIKKDVLTATYAVNQPGDVKRSYTFWS